MKTTDAEISAPLKPRGKPNRVENGLLVECKLSRTIDPALPLAARIYGCQSCPLHANCDHKVGIRRSHPNYLDHPTVDLLFVGEAPSSQDYILRSPFSGPAGHELSELLEESLDPSLTYAITNAVHCTPFVDSSRLNVRTPSLPEITACRTHLEALIGMLKPRHIIALGKVAEKSLKKIAPAIPWNVLTHPEDILASKQPDLERARFTLTIEGISNCLCEQ